MPRDHLTPLDAVDRLILQLLQQDGRTSTADLARAVSMSASATADRLRRLHDLGVIRGYTALVDPRSLGLVLTAFARVRLGPAGARTFLAYLEQETHVVEAHHLTGEDCYLVKLVGADMAALERISDRLATFGQVSTNIVYSSPIAGRPVPTADHPDPAEGGGPTGQVARPGGR